MTESISIVALSVTICKSRADARGVVLGVDRDRGVTEGSMPAEPKVGVHQSLRNQARHSRLNGRGDRSVGTGCITVRAR